MQTANPPTASNDSMLWSEDILPDVTVGPPTASNDSSYDREFAYREGGCVCLCLAERMASPGELRTAASNHTGRRYEQSSVAAALLCCRQKKLFHNHYEGSCNPLIRQRASNDSMLWSGDILPDVTVGSPLNLQQLASSDVTSNSDISAITANP